MRYIVQYIPAWFPGAAFRRIGIEGTQLGKKVRFDGLNFVEQDMVGIFILSPTHFNSLQANGIVDESIISKYINDPSISRDHLRDAVGSMYLGK
jgi:hypothetical protein